MCGSGKPGDLAHIPICTDLPGSTPHLLFHHAHGRTLIPLLFALPWLALPLAAVLLVRRRPVLERWVPARGLGKPSVSVIVPARNEQENLDTCLRSLAASGYAPLEILVVDDGSTDRTGEVARAVAQEVSCLRVISGAPLPSGWFGKSWACTQGAGKARGDLLAFADADIQVHSELIGRSVAALQASQAGLLSVVPRQVLGGFWERLVMPHFLLLFLLRFPDPDRVNRSGRTRDKVALGGWIVVRRDAYEAVGGHAAVRSEISEDLRLAQVIHAAGYRPLLVFGERFLSVRMYRSLAQITEGWSKNLAISSRQTVTGPVRWLVPWFLLLWLVGMWIVPPAALVLGSLGLWQAASVTWGVLATGALVLLGGLICRRLEIAPGYALLFPLGAIVAAGIVLLSILRGERIHWKGRKYRTGELQQAT